MAADIIDFATRKRIQLGEPEQSKVESHPESLRSLTDYLAVMDVEDNADIRNAIIVIPTETGGVYTTYFDWHQDTDASIKVLEDAIERLRGFK
jgi:hypothetical protein